MVSWLPLVLYALSSFSLCLILTPIVRKVAVGQGWMAVPSKERWHKKPTALLGGIAIYLGMAVPLFLIADFQSVLPHIFRKPSPTGLPSIDAVIWIGITVLFILGLLDDFLSFKPQTKLVVQIMVASLVAFLGFRMHWFESLTLDTLVTIFWIVGVTNAFNLMDNMDGLCAGIGGIAACFLAMLYINISMTAAIPAVLIAGALAAFLIYNFNPATIFMGDSGSLLIGFTLSMLSFYFSEAGSGNTLSIYAVPLLILMVPIFDTTLVTLIRILSGRKASTGGKDHTSHRLVLMGFSERSSVLFLYSVGILSGLSALFVSRSDTLTSPVVIIPAAVSFLLMGVYLAQLRVYPEKEFSLLRDRAYTPVLIEVTYKKQILMIMFDFGLIAFAYYLSYRLRFSGQAFKIHFKLFLISMPIVIACKFIAFYATGIYRGIWRYLSTNDVFLYIKASVLASLLSITAATYIYRFESFSKGIFVIDWLLTTGFLLGTRGSFRFFVDTVKRKTLAGDRIFIYGAGRGGEILLREIFNNPRLNLKPIGFIDDDMLKNGKKIQGYPILGSLADMHQLLKKYEINGILVSFYNKDPDKLSNIKKFCKKNGLFLKQFSICLEDMD
jgi:UDP-GlcNAc:undecaprenyl-phosphate/decaprenyl-phosphate GlcNAc-1-phosphate transferase